MSVDERASKPSRSSTQASYVVLMLALLAGVAYLAWQIAPLESRVAALERQLLAQQDDVAAQREQIEQRLAILRSIPTPHPRPFPPATAPVGGATAVPAPPSSTPAPSGQPAQSAAAQDAAGRFLQSHLLPEDARLAAMIYLGATPGQIAQQTRHSIAYVIAKGVLIDKELSADPRTPPDVQKAVRTWLAGARPQKSGD